MNGSRTAGLGLVLTLAACQSPDVVGPRTLRDLAPGMWVSAQGVGPTGKKLDKIREEQRSGSSASDKVDVKAPVQPRGRDQLTVLDREVEIVDKTTWEDLERKETPRFEVAPGEWLDLKLRRKADNYRARTIRRTEPRGQFQIEGEVSKVDEERGLVEIGGVPLQVTRRTSIQLLSDQGAGVAVDDPLAVFQEDDQKSVPFTIRLSDALRLGGQVTFGDEQRDEFDLDRTRRRDRNDLDVEAKLDLLWLTDATGSFALFEATFARGDEFREGEPDRTNHGESISRAYYYYRHSDELRATIGRQDFDDVREWLFDEVLDAVRVNARFGRAELDVGAGVGREFADETNPTEDTETFIGQLHYEVDDDHQLSAYVVHRSDSSLRDFEPTLFGLRSYARPHRGFGHWLELSRAVGHAGPLDIDGYAYDAGVIYRLDAPLRPTFVVGYAYGTGRRPGSGEEGFRQTGLQDNNGKFGGVTSFRYYGELFEPELSNIGISTFGVGIRPVSSMSIDLIAHNYRQDFIAPAVLSDNIRPAPNGLSANLGWEADLVFGYRRSNWLQAELILARFEPGGAFDQQDAAHKADIQVRIKF